MRRLQTSYNFLVCASTPFAQSMSKELEICSEDCADKFTKYRLSSSKRVSYWIPKELKDGDRAPVVVYLHGFFALVPEIYQDHIDHLVKQGYIVIFPQYQGGMWNLISELGIFKKTDQIKWLKDAIRSTNEALKHIGNRADLSKVYGYGHSVGGMLLLGWEKMGGPKMDGMVLANPQVDLKTGLPEFVRRIVKINPLPWKRLADGVTGNVFVLSGDKDTIALPKKSNDILASLKNAKSQATYIASSHKHGDIELSADHFSPMTNGGLLEYLDKLMDTFGGRIEVNTYDHRYYYATLDAVLDGQTEYEPDMGYWSDGTPFAKVRR